MQFVIFTINEMRHIFSLFIAALLLVLPSMERRSRFALRVWLCAAILLFVCPLYGVFYTFLPRGMSIISVVWYIFVVVLVGVAITVCFKSNFTVLLWTMLAAYAVEHFVYVLVNEIIFMGIAGFKPFDTSNPGNFFMTFAVYSVACAAVFYFFYRLFKPNINYIGNFYLRDNVKNRIMLGIFLAVFFAATMLNQQNTQNAANGFNFLGAVSDLVNCLFVLIVQVISLSTSRISFEKQLSENLLSDEKRQYEAFKNSVDYINIKCHDLKHEITRIRRSGAIDTGKLDEIASGVTLYEAFAKTGNETLDIILTEKNLACNSGDISFSFMADASALEIMDASDIYSLFGNLLDNAIEHVSAIEDKDKRYIRLFVRPQGNMLLIHEENYYAGDGIQDGILKTTKSDAVYHGFGIKSMKRTAQKYGGDLKITVEENIFKADILISILTSPCLDNDKTDVAR